MEKSETRLSMKLLIFFLLLSSPGCGNQDCNMVTATFSGHVLMNRNALVITDHGIAGHVEEISYQDHVTRMKLCLLDPRSISRNSKVEAGFVPAYGGRCILIRPSPDLKFLANDETLVGIVKDTIRLGFPSESEADNALKKNALEILKEQNRKDSLKNRER